MKKLFFIVCMSVLLVFQGYASHIRAGEITARRISNSNFEFEITLVVYTKMSSGISIDSATLFALDAGNQEVWRETRHFTDTQNVGNDVLRSRYVFTHIFNAGKYIIGFRDENRVGGVLNMDNSLNTAFYVETMLLLDPLIGLNNTPELLVPPIDDGAVNQVYNYNPGAFDADGDLLTYEMDIPLSDNGIQVLNYRDPGQVGSGNTYIQLDSLLGNMEWNVPKVPGIYNIAYKIFEWRNGQIISYIHRDMQITIIDDNNNKPQLSLPADTCVLVGQQLDAIVRATDPDADILDFTAYGGIFPPATFADTIVGFKNAGVFHWKPGCQDVREAPYQISFKADDWPSHSPAPSLVDIKTWQVKVTGPKVENLSVQEITTGNLRLKLTWTPYSCSNASTINIYRKGCQAAEAFDTCQEISPAQLGYEFIGSVAANVSSYEDFSVQKGQNYCYVVQAGYPAPESGKGLMSDESCAIAGTQYPMITQVTVTKTDKTNGEIYISWERPIDTSIVFTNGSLRVWRSVNGVDNFIDLGGFPFGDATDVGLNTVDNQYYYKVSYLDSESDIASSVYLNADGGTNQINLTWNASVPWNNFSNYHYIYSKNNDSVGGFTLLDSVYVLFDEDQMYQQGGLTMTDTICYYVTTVGSYCNGIDDSVIINNSQRICSTPKDEVPPCAPTFSMKTDCETTSPFINWLRFVPLVAPPLCINDVVSYDVWYAAHEDDSLELLTSVEDTFFHHKRTNSIAGCYYVTAKDLTGNISPASDTICIDNCPLFLLPNIFTPNDDAENQLFIPIPPSRFIQNVQFRVYNRWGRLIFETDDLNINWKGEDINNSKVPDGMYYYEANVQFYRLRKEDENQTYKGWVRISR